MLQELEAAETPTVVLLGLERAIRCPKAPLANDRKLLRTIDPTALVSAYLKLIQKHNLASLTRPFAPTFHRAPLALRQVLAQPRARPARPAHLLSLPQRLCSRELLAIYLLLLVRSAWNSRSLLSLTTDRIKPVDGGVAIQGYKSKTDDDTPEVIIESNDHIAFESIQLLLWNQQQLKRLGFLDGAETRLWFSWSNHGHLYSEQFIGFQSLLTQFQERYQLPRFSPDQIRAQRLAQIAIGPRTPELARALAGHRSLSTTGHYLDSPLLRRFNSAINLEFQRQFEATLRYRLKDHNQLFAENLEHHRVNNRLLVSVSGGTSCVAPLDPPDSSYKIGPLCGGTHCHDGPNGCANRRLIIDNARMVELARARHYIRTYWAQHLQENPSTFETTFAPSACFTLALYSYVANGPYGHTLRRIERDLGISDA
jgi:hypothetical protein